MVAYQPTAFNAFTFCEMKAGKCTIWNEMKYNYGNNKKDFNAIMNVTMLSISIAYHNGRISSCLSGNNMHKGTNSIMISLQLSQISFANVYALSVAAMAISMA